MMWMDVDAALSEVPVNAIPLTDDTDFKSREVSITYNQSGMDLVWNFVTTAGAFTQTAVTPTTAGTYDWTNQGKGFYTLEIPASGGASINNDTEGYGWFSGFATGVLPWTGPIIGFRAAGLNDALIDSAYSTTRGLAGTALPNAAAEAAGGLYTRGTGAGQINQANNGQVDANAARTGGTTNTGRDIGASVLLSAGTGTGQLDFTSGVVKANLAQILGTALTETAGLIAAGFKQFFNIGSPTSTMNTITTVTTATNLTNAPTAGDLTATMKTSVTTAATAATPTAAAVTGAVGSVTARVTANTDQLAGQTVTASTGVTFPASLASPTNITAGTVTTATNVTTVNGLAANVITAASIAADAGAEIADAVWDEATAGHTTAGTTGKALTDAGSAGDPWGTAIPGAYGAGTAGYILGTNLDAPTSDAATPAEVAAALNTYDAPTNAEMVARTIAAASYALDATVAKDATVATASALSTAQTAITAIKAKTDPLTFTVAGQVDVNVQYVNDAEVAGTGTPGNEWGPA